MSKKETALMLAAVAGTIGTIGGIERNNHLSTELRTANATIVENIANEGKTRSQIFEEKWLKGPDSIRELAKKNTDSEPSSLTEELASNWQNAAINRPELNKETDKIQNLLTNLSRLDGSEANKYMRLTSKLQDQIDKIVANYKENSGQDEIGFAKQERYLDELQSLINKVSADLKLESLKNNTEIPNGV